MFEVDGDPDSPCVVLLPAFGLHRSMWTAQRTFLVSRGYRVVVMDLPGVSGANEPPFSMSGAA